MNGFLLCALFTYMAFLDRSIILNTFLPGVYILLDFSMFLDTSSVLINQIWLE
jgi:hypothetical protein